MSRRALHHRCLLNEQQTQQTAAERPHPTPPVNNRHRQAQAAHLMARCTTATERRVREAAKRAPKAALPSMGTPSQKE
jgi:hypothetical protein